MRMTGSIRGSSVRRSSARGLPSVTLPFQLLCCVFLSLLLNGCGSSPRPSAYTSQGEQDRKPELAERLNQQAAAVIDSDCPNAERLLRESLAADLYCGPAHNNLGTILLRQGKLYEAAQEFEWAKRLLPGHPDPRMNLALTLEMAGRTDEALQNYHTALDVYPNHLPTLQALTRLQVRANKVSEETNSMLSEVALRGESREWKDWARKQLSKTKSEIRPK